MKKYVVLAASLFCFFNFVRSQSYSIVIKDGRVIDPKNNINDIMDVAIQNGKIVSVAKKY